MEHIEMKYSLGSKLQIHSICSVRILNIIEVIAKIAKCSTPNRMPTQAQVVPVSVLVVLAVAPVAQPHPNKRILSVTAKNNRALNSDKIQTQLTFVKSI